MKTPNLLPVLLGCGALLLAGGSAQAGIAYGSINNFDTVNDTGEECHGFEIELEDCHSTDITYTYNYNHYGTSKITEDNSDPAHPRCVIRWESSKNADGTWAAYTAIPSGPIDPTNGHMFTNPSVNFGGEHFGVGFRGAPTAVRYHWLLDDRAGNLVAGPPVQVATPTFTYNAGVGGGVAQVQAAIQAPEAPEFHPKEFGDAVWVKEIRTSSHNKRKIKLRELVSDDPGDADDVNWRNGEPDEVETEWQILQTEFAAGDGGANGELVAAAEDLPDGDEVVTRRYEFYAYTGPIDDESGEVGTDNVGPDGVHGDGTGTVNGVEYDFSTVEVVGDYLGSQMAAFDPEAGVGLVEQLQDGEVGEDYPDRTVVVAGATPFTASQSGVLPEGMGFDDVTGVLSGTPTLEGEYTFTIEATDAVAAEPVAKTYTILVAAPGEALPPHAVVDTTVVPAGSGTTLGDGAYGIGEVATVVAAPEPGFLFANWTDNGVVVSDLPAYELPVDVNHSLVANFTETNPLYTIATVAVPVLGGSTGGDGDYPEGTEVTVTATANPDYDFVNWTENGTQVSPSPSYTFTATTSRVLTAHFNPSGGPLKTLVLESDPPEGGSTMGAGTYAEGTDVTVTATPNPGYLFKRWVEGSSKVSESATYTFTLDQSTTLTARFAPAYEIVTASSPAEGGGTSGGGLFEDGDRVVVVATAQPGYRFTRWTEDGDVVSTLANFQFKANPDRSLVANFELVVPEPWIVGDDDGGFFFEWPAGLPGWVLEESPDMSPGSWTESELEVVDDAGNRCAHFVPDPAESRRFLRLSHP
jgi:hypothetical protein